MTHEEHFSVQKRVDRLGLTKDWRTVDEWAKQSKKVELLDGIVVTLEGAIWAQIEDCAERALVVKIAGRAKNSVTNTPAESGAVAEAKTLREELVIAIGRTGVDPMEPTELERTRGWDGKKYAEMDKRALWRYDIQLARAGRHLLAALRILSEPSADSSELVNDALAKRKIGRPRQSFNRAAVEQTLIDQLKAIAPPDVTTAEVERLATRLLTKLQP